MLLIVILVLAVPGSSQNHPCNKYTVRLDRNNSAGRLQICWSEGETLQRHSVCTMLNDDAAAAAASAAAVVCRQLGFNSAGNQGTFGVGLQSSF